jgi:hypothetical protein
MTTGRINQVATFPRRRTTPSAVASGPTVGGRRRRTKPLRPHLPARTFLRYRFENFVPPPTRSSPSLRRRRHIRFAIRTLFARSDYSRPSRNGTVCTRDRFVDLNVHQRAHVQHAPRGTAARERPTTTTDADNGTKNDAISRSCSPSGPAYASASTWSLCNCAAGHRLGDNPDPPKTTFGLEPASTSAAHLPPHIMRRMGWQRLQKQATSVAATEKCESPLDAFFDRNSGTTGPIAMRFVASDASRRPARSPKISRRSTDGRRGYAQKT